MGTVAPATQSFSASCLKKIPGKEEVRKGRRARSKRKRTSSVVDRDNARRPRNPSSEVPKVDGRYVGDEDSVVLKKNKGKGDQGEEERGEASKRERTT